jgi:hypothetical protein
MRTTAITGTGLIATPTASGRMSPIAAPMGALFHVHEPQDIMRNG